MAKTGRKLPFEIDISFEGVEPWLNVLAQTLDWAISPFSRKLAERFRFRYSENVKDAFTSHGKSVGGWPPLTRRYAAAKKKKFPGRPLLIRTAKMSRETTNIKDRAFVFRNQNKGRRVVLGSTNPIAPFHQAGTKRMQARPLFVLDRGFSQQIGNLAVGDLYQNMRQVQLGAYQGKRSLSELGDIFK